MRPAGASAPRPRLVPVHLVVLWLSAAAGVVLGRLAGAPFLAAREAGGAPPELVRGALFALAFNAALAVLLALAHGLEWAAAAGWALAGRSVARVAGRLALSALPLVTLAAGHWLADRWVLEALRDAVAVAF